MYYIHTQTQRKKAYENCFTYFGDHIRNNMVSRDSNLFCICCRRKISPKRWNKFLIPTYIIGIRRSKCLNELDLVLYYLKPLVFERFFYILPIQSFLNQSTNSEICTASIRIIQISLFLSNEFDDKFIDPRSKYFSSTKIILVWL